jgi:ABC-2 type transport system permease protein
MNHLPLIIKREYLNKVRNKSFIVMTFLSPLIFVAIFALVGYLSSLNNANVREISILDESGVIAQGFENTATETYTVLSNTTLDQAKIIGNEGAMYGVLYIPNTEDLEDLATATIFYSKDSPSLSILRDIENTIESHVNTARLKEANIDAEKIKALRIKVNTKQESFEGKETSKADSIAKLIFGGAAGYLLFMFIIIYGNMIMRSVIEEKTSRIIEVIISSVKPIKLLLGKIIGTSLAGVTQFVAWVVLISILTTVVTLVFGIDPSAAQSSQQEMIAQANGGSGDLIAQAYGAYESYHLPIWLLCFCSFLLEVICCTPLYMLLLAQL